MDLWFIGAILSVLGSVASNLGVNIQKGYRRRYFDLHVDQACAAVLTHADLLFDPLVSGLYADRFWLISLFRPLARGIQVKPSE